MQFKGIQAAKTCHQLNLGTREQVFPLLCPVREKDWVDGWEYEIIHSLSGYAEKGCVFSTPHHGKEKTIWYINQYDPEKYEIEFVRHTPGEEVVRIHIQLLDNGDKTTTSVITYEYTALNPQKNDWIQTTLDSAFTANMKEWELSINHYLKTGQKLILTS